MKPKNIELHIEELVLHGFAPGDRFRIAEAVEQELGRLLLEQQDVSPLFEKSGKIERLNAGTFKMTPGIRPEAVGARVAQAVHSGLGDGAQNRKQTK